MVGVGFAAVGFGSAGIAVVGVGFAAVGFGSAGLLVGVGIPVVVGLTTLNASTHWRLYL